MAVLRASPMLAALLSRNRDAVAQAWARALHTEEGERYRKLPLEDLRFWTGRGVDALAAALSTGNARPLDAHVRRVSLVRRRLGFEMGEVLSAVLRVEQAVRPLIFTHEPGEAGRALRMLDDLSACLRIMAARFAQIWAASAERSLREERDRNALLLETGKAVGESIELEATAQRVARYVGRALGASCSCVFPTAGAEWRLAPELLACNGERVAETWSAESCVPYLESLRDQAETGRAPVVRRRTDGDALFREHPQIVAAAAVPVILGDRVLATVVGLSMRDEFAFPAERLALARGVASAVAPALAHAQLYAESVRSLSETRTLQRVTSALLNRIGLASVLEVICRETQHLTGATGSAVLLVQDQGKLEIAFSTGDGAHAADRLLLEHVRVEPGALPVEPMLVNELPVERAGQAHAPGVSSLLAVPLRARGEIIGLMQLVNKHPGFDQDDVRIIGLIADQVAMSIENARLNARQERMAVMEERHRLARDLHDSVTQSVYAVSVLSEATARLLDAGRIPEARRHLTDLRESALTALRQMRHLIFELHPPEIEKLGLVAALRARLAAVEERAGVRTSLECEGGGPLPLDVAEGLYRIAQEAFHNSVKHARASRLALRIVQTADELRLEILDDGAGFDLPAGRAKRGMGLSGMEERAAELGGTLRIDTEPGRGTRIVVRVPLAVARGAAAPGRSGAEVEPAGKVER